MSHEIETMAYAGELPWHGLGTKVDNKLTTAEMLKAAQIDWTVSKLPTFFEVDGEKVSTGKFGLVRDTDNKFLTTVSKSWNPCQNAEAFEIFDRFVDKKDLEMHTAGSLKGGQIVWGLAKMKDSFELFKGDQVDNFLLLVNPHKFGAGIHMRATPIRVVCNNTLSLSLGTVSNIASTQTHRKTFNVEEMEEALGIAKDKMSKYKDMASFLGIKKAEDVELDEYFKLVFPNYGKNKDHVSRNALRAKEILHTQPGSEYAEGSWWQAFNAVTYLTDHELGRNPDTRLQSAWFGVNKDKKNLALESALKYAEKSKSLVSV
jgi:phage/plasmid-like protein (TIGR03299 family)